MGLPKLLCRAPPGTPRGSPWQLRDAVSGLRWAPQLLSAAQAGAAGGLSRCCEALFQAPLALFQACANLFQALHWAPQGSECAGLWPVLLRLPKVSHRANRHCSGLAQMLCGSLLGAALGSPRFLRGSPGAARFTVLLEK